MRNWLFRYAVLVLLLVLLEAAGYLGMYLSSSPSDFLSNRNYFRIRDMLMGRKTPESLPRYLSLPYLGYVPYPGYAKNGIVQHNEDGYRGKRIPLKGEGKFRVLCLGGSTTYGFGVDSPSQTFPAKLEELLSAELINDSMLQKKYTGIEVLNAGLEDGNSAEELQQYLFKYRYYKPDAVIVHSGANDASLLYSLNGRVPYDYTSYRRRSFHAEPLPQPARFLMHSHLFSFFAIRLFYCNFANTSENVFSENKRATVCQWSVITVDSVLRAIDYSEYPFYRNSKSLFESIVADSALLFVMPNTLNGKYSNGDSTSVYLRLNELNKAISKNLAQKAKAVFVPFNYQSISQPGYWIDDCHLTAEGEKEKAQILLPYLLQALTNRNGAGR